YFSHPYADQNQTIKRSFGNKKEFIARPNHSVLNGLRGALISIDSVLLIRKHAPDSDLGKWIGRKIDQDPNFLKQIFFGGVHMCATRRGEEVEFRPALTLRSAALIWNEAKGAFSGLFENDAERASFARAFAYDHKTDGVNIEKINSRTIDANVKASLQEIGIGPGTELSIEEKFLATLFMLGHYNDHRRMFSWSRKKAYANQNNFLKNSGGIESEELRQKIISTLWTRTSYYLQATGAADCDLFAKLGTSNWRKVFGPIKNWGPRLWYRDIRDEHLFFKLSNQPKKAIRLLKNIQATMGYELLPQQSQEDPSYLL
nr:hypothetical protein [Parachlamydiaceae bacterium]